MEAGFWSSVEGIAGVAGSGISVVGGAEIIGASPRFMLFHRASTSIVAPSAFASGFFFSFSLPRPG